MTPHLHIILIIKDEQLALNLSNALNSMPKDAISFKIQKKISDADPASKHPNALLYIFEEDAIKGAELEYAPLIHSTPSIIILAQESIQDGCLMIHRGFQDFIYQNDINGSFLYQSIKKALARKNVENLNTNKYLLELADNIDEVFWVQNANTFKFYYISPTYEKIYGRSRFTIYENPASWMDPIHDEDKKDATKTFFSQKREGKTVLEYRIINASGEERWIRERLLVFPAPGDEGERIFGVSLDITEQKLIEATLERSRREVDMLFSSISLILIGVDEKEQISRWNRAAEHFFGTPASKVMGKPFLECGIEWDWAEVMDHIASMREASEATNWGYIPYNRLDSKKGFLNVTIGPIHDEENHYQGFLLLAQEITERKDLEGQLAQAQKLESIGQLAAGIAHEINTPIQFVGDNIYFLEGFIDDLKNIIPNYMHLLSSNKNGGIEPGLADKLSKELIDREFENTWEEAPRAVELSLKGIKRVTTIVSAMRSLSYRAKEKLIPTDVNEIINNVIIVSRNEWKYDAVLHEDLCQDLPQVPGLPGLLSQVFLNIIVNAAHAIKDKGSKEKGKIGICSARTEAGISVTISDTGTGISPEIINKIFDPLFTTKAVGKGTGQGLTISHDVIVNKHGGTIRVESEEGKGSTFIIELLSKAAVPAAEEA